MGRNERGEVPASSDSPSSQLSWGTQPAPGVQISSLASSDVFAGGSEAQGPFSNSVRPWLKMKRERGFRGGASLLESLLACLKPKLNCHIVKGHNLRLSWKSPCRDKGFPSLSAAGSGVFTAWWGAQVCSSPWGFKSPVRGFEFLSFNPFLNSCLPLPFL